MKPLLITAILAAATTPAMAGDWRIGVGFDSDGDVRLGVGYKSHRHRHRVVHHHTHRRWVPGHWDTVTDKVRVPATRERVYQPAVYEWRTDPFGVRYRVCVREAGYRTVYVPARWEYRTRKVWHPGEWVTIRHPRGQRVHHYRHYRHHRPGKAVRVEHSTRDRRALHRGDRDGRRIRTS